MARERGNAKPNRQARPRGPGTRAAGPGNPAQAADPAAPGPAPAVPWWRKAGGPAGQFVLILGLALGFKQWVADVYYIPTGSMETTLYGRTDGGDRIACLRLPFLWRRPERWEITVFRFPIEHAARGAARGAAGGAAGGQAGGLAAAPGSAEWRRLYDREYQRLRENKDQNYIKRMVGLPGETICLFRGGVWRLADAAGSPEGGPEAGSAGGRLERLVKPQGVQEGMWLPVYRADLGRLSRQELAAWWRPESAGPAADESLPALPAGDHGAWRDWQATGDGALACMARVGHGATLRFMQRVPDGRGRMPRLPAIVDRYVVRQAAQFYCDPDRRHPAGDPEGAFGCGGAFSRTVADLDVTGHCPHCGLLLMEDAVAYYHRRSSLPTSGPWQDSGRGARQREKAPRLSDYHPTAHLRVVAQVRFPDPMLSGDRQVAQMPGQAVLALSDNGREAVLAAAPGRPIRLEAGAFGADADGPGAAVGDHAWHTLELHRTDGRIRACLDSARLFDVADDGIPASLPAPDPGGDWPRGRPPGWPDEVFESGVRLSAADGPVEWGEVSIWRDVHHYADGTPDQGRMGAWGQITLGPDEYLALGDNPPSSYDSRGWGPVPASELGGSAVAIWWPPYRMQALNRGLKGE